MFGLSTLGVIHTLISLVAVAAGLLAFFRDKGIDPANMVGKVYVWTTVLTCVTGFGIFAHGGFGKAHVLGVITLATLAFAWWAGRKPSTGWRIASAVSLSLTFLFHMIPAITETSTRLPLGAPLLASPEAPQLQAATGVLLLLFVAGAVLQVRRLRSR